MCIRDRYRISSQRLTAACLRRIAAFGTAIPAHKRSCMPRERSPPAQKKMTSSDRANLLDKDEEIATPAKKPTITTKKLALSISGVFVLYVLHDALQERAFRQPGFRFGWFMTLIEIVVVSTCAFMFEWGAPPDPTIVSEDAMRTIRMLSLIHI